MFERKEIDFVFFCFLKNIPFPVSSTHATFHHYAQSTGLLFFFSFTSSYFLFNFFFFSVKKKKEIERGSRLYSFIDRSAASLRIPLPLSSSARSWPTRRAGSRYKPQVDTPPTTTTTTIQSLLSATKKKQQQQHDAMCNHGT